MYALIPLGIFAVVMGVSFFLRPAIFAAFFWQIFERWKSYHADEPSDEYAFSFKVAGIAAVIGGIVMILLPFSSFLD